MNRSKRSLINSEDFFKALSNPKRIQIIEIFAERDECLTLKEIHSFITSKNPESEIYRETIYKSLEKLVKGGILEKRYSKEVKVCYSLAFERIVVDFPSLSCYYENIKEDNE